MNAKRTFWEKATLLHSEFHRRLGKDTARGLSRHYYDLYQLCQTEIGLQAVNDVALLKRVVAHKRLFFPSASAHYETAVAGSCHVAPPEQRMSALRADYDRMREMIFGDVPAWERIIRGLRELESSINRK